MLQTIIGHEYPDIVTPLIQKAQHSIDILVYDWRWYPTEPQSKCQLFNLAIVEASQRGVKVNALVNAYVVPRVLSLHTLHVKRVNTRTLMHIKMIIIDKKIAVVGSHNFSKNAFENNHEASMLFDDQPAIARLLNYHKILCHL